MMSAGAKMAADGVDQRDLMAHPDVVVSSVKV